MVIYIIIAFMIIILLGSIMAIIASTRGQLNNRPNDESMLDENGNHIYYERSLIEKQRAADSQPANESARSTNEIANDNSEK